MLTPCEICKRKGGRRGESGDIVQGGNGRGGLRSRRRGCGRCRSGVCEGGWESIAEVDSACAATNTARAATRE
eukprot:gene21457-biopygen8653